MQEKEKRLKNKKGIEIELIQFSKDEKKRIIDLVSREVVINIFVNQKNIGTLNCSPGNLKYLAAGFIYSLGLIKSKQDIISTKIDKKSVFFELSNSLSSELVLSNTTLPSRFNPAMQQTDRAVDLKDRYKIHSKTIFNLLTVMQERAVFFKVSGGVHSCGLAELAGQLVLFCEDIGRYNTIDRIIGEAIFKGIDVVQKVMLTSCRITGGIMQKIVMGNVPIVISKSAVTDYAVRQAESFGITLVGFARGERMNIYTHPERIES